MEKGEWVLHPPDLAFSGPPFDFWPNENDLNEVIKRVKPEVKSKPNSFVLKRFPGSRA